jgi:hypothetical protein
VSVLLTIDNEVSRLLGLRICNAVVVEVMNTGTFFSLSVSPLYRWSP